MHVKFKCSSCGACCRMAGILGEMPRRKDGACAFLTEDNQCSVYIFRPDKCRVKKPFKETAKLCDKLQELFNINKSYRIGDKYGL